MSRSYKKSPYVVQDGKSIGKRYANRKVRRTQDTYNGKLYIKLYNQYNICDWKWYIPPSEFTYKYRNK